MLSSGERARIVKAHSIGPKVADWLSAAGYQRLEDFVYETPENIGFRVEIATGIKANGNALNAYRNLIAYAQLSCAYGQNLSKCAVAMFEFFA